jgi:hypothetical protein
MKDPATIIETIKNTFFGFISNIDVFSIQNFFKNIFIVILSFLAPVTQAIFAVYFLVLLDLITGVWGAIKQKKEITSSAMSRTIGKVLIYSTAIILAYVVHKYLMIGFEFPIETMVSGFIALTETKSIFENINKISKNQFVKDLIVLLSNERNKRIPPK